GVRDDFAGKRLPLLPENATPAEVGYGKIADLTWQHLVSLDACTKCGKCHVVCPANASGYPLSPRDVILDLRELAGHVGPDAHTQRATQALARILHEADADFGILFDAEKTAGCDVRRAGEEGLWAALAEENVKTISGCDFERVFSSDPHTFHTLRNEYPQHGG